MNFHIGARPFEGLIRSRALSIELSPSRVACAAIHNSYKERRFGKADPWRLLDNYPDQAWVLVLAIASSRNVWMSRRTVTTSSLDRRIPN